MWVCAPMPAPQMIVMDLGMVISRIYLSKNCLLGMQGPGWGLELGEEGSDMDRTYG